MRNKRLARLLTEKWSELRGGAMLDCYNQAIYPDISCSITTRINSCNHYYIVESNEDSRTI